MPFHRSSTRRSLLLQSASALLLPGARTLPAAERGPFDRVAGQPNFVRVFSEAGPLELARNASHWQKNAVAVTIPTGSAGTPVLVRSPQVGLLRIQLRWQLAPPANLLYLGDHWERSYGDLAWRHLEPERILPWYFLATEPGATHACGVKTGARAFCFWEVDSAGVSLWLDVRNGGRPVKLGQRELAVASIAVSSYNNLTPFSAACRFCRTLCDKPRLPAAPVYGGNNWYYAYGKSSAEDIRSDSERISGLATSSGNRPFMVIDDGWQPNPTAGPWSRGNAHFPDMPKLAADMRRIGVQPGLWVRPLFTKEAVSPGWQLRSPNAQAEYRKHQASTLDPTVPEALEQVQSDIRRAAQWGYSLIKHDFSSYDLLGRWGFAMGSALTDDNWGFQDETRTTAEVIASLYQALREAAGSALLLGCNTTGHLGAGLFELQRTGDDTSGRDWNRTRKMGVNTLAFRGPQHNAFFAVDADCVGLTRQIPWNMNRQWLDLLARSGTPLFVSAAPDAVGPEQRTALRAAFQIAATVQPLGEPLDWTTVSEPAKWRLAGKTETYDWFGASGASPFTS